MVHQAKEPERVDPLEIVDGASIYKLTEGAIILDTIFEGCTDEDGVIDVPEGYFEQRVKIGELTEDKIEAICKTVTNYRTKETRAAEAIAELTEVFDNIPLVKSIREELERLEGRKRSMENRVKNTKDLLKWYLETTGQKSVEMGTFRVWRQRNSAPSVHVNDLAQYEEWDTRYVRFAADKKAIAKAFKADQKTMAVCKNCGATIELKFPVNEDKWVYIAIGDGEEDVNKKRFAFHCCEDQEVWESISQDENWLDNDFPESDLIELKEGETTILAEISWSRAVVYKDPPELPWDDIDIDEGEHIRIK